MDPSELKLMAQVKFPPPYPMAVFPPFIYRSIRNHSSRAVFDKHMLMCLFTTIIRHITRYISECLHPVVAEWVIKLPRIYFVVEGDQCFFGIDESYVLFSVKRILLWCFFQLLKSELFECESFNQLNQLVAKEIAARVNYNIAKQMNSNTRHLVGRSYECDCIIYENLTAMIALASKITECICTICRCVPQPVEASCTAPLQDYRQRKTPYRSIWKGRIEVIYSTSETALMAILSEGIYPQNDDYMDMDSCSETRGEIYVVNLNRNAIMEDFEENEEDIEEGGDDLVDFEDVDDSEDLDVGDNVAGDFGAGDNDIEEGDEIEDFEEDDDGEDFEEGDDNGEEGDDIVEDDEEYGEENEGFEEDDIEDFEEDENDVEDFEDSYNDGEDFEDSYNDIEDFEDSYNDIEDFEEDDGGEEFEEGDINIEDFEEDDEEGYNDMEDFEEDDDGEGFGEYDDEDIVDFEEDGNVNEDFQEEHNDAEDLEEAHNEVEDVEYGDDMEDFVEIQPYPEADFQRSVQPPAAEDQLQPDTDFQHPLLPPHRCEGATHSCDSNHFESAKMSEHEVRKYTLVLWVVTGLLMHTMKKAQASMCQVDFNRIVLDLSHKALQQMKFRDITLTMKEGKNVYKALFSELSQIFDPATVLLKELQHGNNIFIDALKRHLTVQIKKKHTVTMFISTVSRYVSKSLRSLFNLGCFY
ncbi:hypothetical protein JOB18_046797 [Solea senegalensis]|uniref:Uncharacterized protein n=1 Tax=Solea senegalensis TaxID=28829 RepID=A0AAV6SGV2_SOLSE|nr:hypothetical protein JOB18_046797 [Solea senegalensis]